MNTDDEPRLPFSAAARWRAGEAVKIDCKSQGAIGFCRRRRSVPSAGGQASDSMAGRVVLILICLISFVKT